MSVLASVCHWLRLRGTNCSVVGVGHVCDIGIVCICHIVSVFGNQTFLYSLSRGGILKWAKPQHFGDVWKSCLRNVFLFVACCMLHPKVAV